jgi:hypothetical protein
VVALGLSPSQSGLRTPECLSSCTTEVAALTTCCAAAAAAPAAAPAATHTHRVGSSATRFLLIGRVHILLERFNRHARLFMSLGDEKTFVTKASRAAMIASEADDLGQLANAQEAYLIAIKYLNMAKMQYANDPSCWELVQR